MPQQLLSLWTVAADDVTRGANASEEVHADCRRGASGGNIGQVNVYADFSARGRLRAWDRRDSGSADTNYGYICVWKIQNSFLYCLHFTPRTWIGWGFCWCWTGAGGRRSSGRGIPLQDSTLAPYPAFPWAWSLGGLSNLATKSKIELDEDEQ